METITGISWSLSTSLAAGLGTVLLVVVLLLFMVLLSSRRIKNLPPVVALRGGISTHSFRRNFFPRHKGIGNVQTRLGLKNMFAYGKLYTMIGFVIAGITTAITFMAVTYQSIIDAQLGTFASGIILIMQFVTVISSVIISLILFMTVRSIISKRRRELGTLKAGGFTTKELAAQLGISFTPRLFSALGLLIIFATVGVAIISATRIKDISAYDLLSE